MILGQNGIFLVRLDKFGQNENFFKKSLVSFVPNFMPSFRKILGAVSEINCVTYGRTDARTDKGDIIEPVASLGQKKFGKISEKIFFDFFFDLHIENTIEKSQKKIFFGGKKISFFEKTMKKKICKNFGKFFFPIFFFALHIE